MSLPVASQLDLQKIPVLGLVAETAASGSSPASPVNGQFWYDTTNNRMNARVNSTWQPLAHVAELGSKSPSAWDKDVAQAVATTNVATLSGTGTVIDGYTTAANDRVLLTGQTTTTQNGLWVVNSGAWTRPTDYSTAAYTRGATVSIVNGTANAGTTWHTLGTADLVNTGTTWYKIADAADVASLNSAKADKTITLTAGSGLTGGGDLSANRSFAVSGLTSSNFAAGSIDGTAGTASLRTIGTGAQQAMAGNTTLSSIAAPTGAVSLNSQNITTLADPVNPQDAATKNYVDTAIQGLDIHPSVRAASTGANVTIPPGGTTFSLDGVTLANGNRVLLKDQTTASQNGIYVVGGVGSSVTLTRATDADSSAEMTAGAFVFVEEGTANADSGWTLTTDNPITLGTTGLTFTQFSGAGQITAGAGLSKTGNTLDVNVDSSSIEINADILRVKALGITNAMLAGSIDLTTKVTGNLPVANGGTGSNTAAGARTNLGVPAVYETPSPVALTGGSTSTITHNLNTQKVNVSVVRSTDNAYVLMAWTANGVNTILLAPDVSMSVNVIVEAKA